MLVTCRLILEYLLARELDQGMVCWLEIASRSEVALMSLECHCTEQVVRSKVEERSSADRGLVHFGVLAVQSVLVVRRPTSLEQHVDLDLVHTLVLNLAVQLLQCSFLCVEVVEEAAVEARNQSWVAEVCRMRSVGGEEPSTMEAGHFVDVGCDVGMVSCAPILEVEGAVNCTSNFGSEGKVALRLEMEAMHSLGRLDMGMEEDLVGAAIVAFVDVVIACMDLTALVSV